MNKTGYIATLPMEVESKGDAPSCVKILDGEVVPHPVYAASAEKVIESLSVLAGIQAHDRVYETRHGKLYAAGKGTGLYNIAFGEGRHATMDRVNHVVRAAQEHADALDSDLLIAAAKGIRNLEASFSAGHDIAMIVGKVYVAEQTLLELAQEKQDGVKLNRDTDSVRQSEKKSDDGDTAETQCVACGVLESNMHVIDNAPVQTETGNAKQSGTLCVHDTQDGVEDIEHEFKVRDDYSSTAEEQTTDATTSPPDGEHKNDGATDDGHCDDDNGGEDDEDSSADEEADDDGMRVCSSFGISQRVCQGMCQHSDAKITQSKTVYDPVFVKVASPKLVFSDDYTSSVVVMEQDEGKTQHYNQQLLVRKRTRRGRKYKKGADYK